MRLIILFSLPYLKLNENTIIPCIQIVNISFLHRLVKKNLKNDNVYISFRLMTSRIHSKKIMPYED